MKSFSTYIAERKGEKAHRDAVAMGLQYKGFGYWADPQTGEAKYKTVNDNLVPVEGDVESDLYKGDDVEGDPAASGGGQGQMAVPGGAAAGALPPVVGDGSGLGGPADGMDAQAPKNSGWEAGPEGDTCVGGQKPGEIAKDVFVGKTNYVNWTAGPEGSNAMTMELGEMRRWITEGTFTKELRRKQAADQKIRDIEDGVKRSAPDDETAGKIKRMIARGELDASKMKAAGFVAPKTEPQFSPSVAPGPHTDDESGGMVSAPKMMQRRPETVPPEPTGPEQGPKRPLNRPGAGTMMRRAMGAQKNDGDVWAGDIQPARDAVQKAKEGGNDVALGNQIAQMMAIRNNDEDKGTGLDATFNQDEQKRVEMFKKILRLPAALKDGEAVKGLNEAIKGLIKNPDFDLDQVGADDDEDSDSYLDEGAFGSVFDAGDAVIKKGQLGPKEIQALYAMRDSPYFPDLINARFDGVFKHQSSEYNNPLQKPSRARGQDGQAANDYWDPQDQSEWEDKYPSAAGTYAMSKAKGGPLYQMWDELTPEAQEKAKRQFWEARGQLHQAGISHNDMHDGNIFVDEEGNVQIIDLGLANDNPLSALMEGMGGMNFEEGEDYQLGNYMGGSGAPESLRQRMLDNLEGVIEMIQDQWSLDGADYDDYDEDEDYSAKMSDGTEMIDRMRQGQIRMQPDSLELMETYLPLLQNKDTVMSLIKRLYQNMGVEDDEEDSSEVGQMLQSIKKPEIGGFSSALDRLRGLGVNTTRMDKVKQALDMDD